MKALPSVSAIVLAGGRSSRFGRDKLSESIGDDSLLGRAVDAVAVVSSDVLVVTGPDGRPDVPPGAREVRDESAFEGPLAGCLAGLLVAREALVLVVAGDMPALQPAVLGMLVRALEGSEADAAALEHRGRPQLLPLALRTGTGTDVSRRLLADRERRLAALVERLRVRLIPEIEWRALDPAARTLVDIDEPDDLAGLEAGPR